MFQRLVSHNDDIRRLVEKGYAVGFDSNCLVIRDIPYLDQFLQLQIGAFVTKLVFVDQNKVVQDDHQVYFAGSVPYNLDGKPIPNLAGGPIQLPLSPHSRDVVVERSFSNNPRITHKFLDFFEKIESYVSIISGPAMAKFDASPFTYRIVEHEQEDSVFKLQDTLTSRAEITDLSNMFKDEVVAIIGLGGTGSYILDFLAKTPVKEILIFDADHYYVHNAFRSPGRLQEDELGSFKASVYGLRYENFRKGLKAIPRFVDETCKEDFMNVTFAFICVDKGSSRATIIDLLVELKIPFIDVGMGLGRKGSTLKGMIRTSYFSTDAEQITKEREMVPLSNNPDDAYKTNIQISELNALNACLAVIRYKQLRGFYKESVANFNLLFDISDMKIVGSDLTDDTDSED